MTDTKTTAVATAPVRVEHTQALFDTDRFEQFQRVASALRFSSLLSPSIRGDGSEQCFSNLMIVCEMAERWKMSPSALGQTMSIIHGKVCVEGKAIQAALESTLGVELYPWWVGERGTDEYRIFLSDHPWDDMDDRDLENLKAGLQIKGRKIVDGSVGEWKTTYQPKGSQRWETQPAWQGAASQDQLLYRATRQWTRRYKPSLIMGVYADDEIEAIEERRERRHQTTVSGPAITAGFTVAAKVEEPEEAIVEEIGQTAEELEGEISHFDTVEGRKAVIEEAYECGLEGRVYALNMALGEDLIKEAEEALERGQIQRYGNLCDGVIVSIIKGEIPSYDGITDKDFDQVKAAAEAAHAFREKALDLARKGILPAAFDIDESEPVSIGAVGDVENFIIPNEAADILLDEIEKLLDEAEARDGQVKTTGDDNEEDLSSEGELTDAGDDADPWRTRLEGCSSWLDIKTAFVQLTKTEQWSAFDEEEQNRLRAITWERQQAINDSGAERLDMITDFTAFRCWIEYTTDPDAIEGNWQTLTASAAWEAAAMRIRDAMVPAVRDRIRALR